jgi:hypothetical protein
MTFRPECKTCNSRLSPLCVTVLLAVGAGSGAASAADRATCKMIAGLLNATDKGLEDTALGLAGRSTTLRGSP